MNSADNYIYGGQQIGVNLVIHVGGVDSAGNLIAVKAAFQITTLPMASCR